MSLVGHQARRRAPLQVVRHVHVLHEAVSHRHGEHARGRAAAPTGARLSSTYGTGIVVTSRVSTRSCSTLLCRRLCSQRRRRAARLRRHEDRGARHPGGRLPFDVARGTWRSGWPATSSRSATIRRPGLPGGHHREEDRADHQRQPAAVGDLQRVGAEEGEVDGQEDTGDGKHDAGEASPIARWRPRAAGSTVISIVSVTAMP